MQIAKLLFASPRLHPQKHVPITLVGKPYLSLVYLNCNNIICQDFLPPPSTNKLVPLIASPQSPHSHTSYFRHRHNSSIPPYGTHPFRHTALIHSEIRDSSIPSYGTHLFRHTVLIYSVIQYSSIPSYSTHPFPRHLNTSQYYLIDTPPQLSFYSSSSANYFVNLYK